MAESVAFYTEKLGLKLLRGPVHYPGNADMAFVGADWDAYIELVYDLEDHAPYELGNRYEHLALEVDDVPATIERLRTSRASKSSKSRRSRPTERGRSRSSRIPTEFRSSCSSPTRPGG